MARINGTAGNDILVGDVDLANLDDTIIGDAGDDVLFGLAGNDSLFGGDGQDILSGGLGDDLLDGGAGIDIAYYGDAISLDGVHGITVDLNKVGPQAIGADQGTDTLVGIEHVIGSLYNDVLSGDANNNTLEGLNGSDVLTGGQGDDVLTGGADADTFSYSFLRSEGTGRSETFKGWLTSQNLPTSGWTQDFFASKYTAFLQHLVDTYHIGADVNGDGKVKVDINQNSAAGTPKIEGLSAQELSSMFGDRESVSVKTGKTVHERWYSDSFKIDGGGEQALKSADGHDTIADFTFGVDKLDFSGAGTVTEAQFHSLFSVIQTDANHDGTNDTVIAIADSDFSVTLVGVNGHTEAEIYDQIHFS